MPSVGGFFSKVRSADETKAEGLAYVVHPFHGVTLRCVTLRTFGYACRYPTRYIIDCRARSMDIHVKQNNV